jgi:hypothetical protein
MIRPSEGLSGNNNTYTADGFYSLLSPINDTNYQVQFMPAESTDYAPGYDGPRARPTPISLGWDSTQWVVKDFYDLVIPEKYNNVKEPFLRLNEKHSDNSSTPRIVYLDKSA